MSVEKIKMFNIVEGDKSLIIQLYFKTKLFLNLYLIL